jgi:hypothetical protein
MFFEIRNQLQRIVSGVAAKQIVADISRYHRIQASPDYRQAAEMVYETLLAWGLEAQLISYPANESVRLWNTRMFQEWSAVRGKLRLIAPASKARMLADFRDVRLSLIPRSAPFEGEVEVVVPREKGEEPGDYAGLDVTGKVVITNGSVMRVHKLAVEDRGAVGIIFDGMRTLEPVSPEWALPDVIQYTSFWWWNTCPKGFGFALTPRVGHWLRGLVKDTTAREPVRLEASVVSRLYDGAIENVTATIPGQTDDEIVLVSHLCHPNPCANDNASGAAATMEVAHALHTLIEAGDLSRPNRSLRFLWVPEMTGTFAYLATGARDGSLPNMVAGLNLDMVGEDQEQCGSVMLIDSPPEASTSFAVDLLEHIREELSGQGESYAQRGQFPLFRYATVPFSGGSDHYIFSDPTIGVPMPMLNQWPDRFYHTTADTIDRVSADTLSRSCLLAGTYAYWLAAAGPRQVEWLAHEMMARFKRRVVARLQSAITSTMAETNNNRNQRRHQPWRTQLDYWIERQHAAFESLCRLQSDFNPKPWSRAASYFAASEWAALEDVLQERPKPTDESDATDLLRGDERAHRVPRRLFPGPVSERPLLRFHQPELAERLRELRKAHEGLPRTLFTLALFWADGQRTVAEIATLVELETGIQAAAPIADYFDILVQLEAVEW